MFDRSSDAADQVLILKRQAFQSVCTMKVATRLVPGPPRCLRGDAPRKRDGERVDALAQAKVLLQRSL